MSDKIELNAFVDKNFKKIKELIRLFRLIAFSDDLMIRNIDDNWSSKNSIIFKKIVILIKIFL